MQQLRNEIHDEETPPVKMEIGYQCKESGEIQVVKDVESAPVSRFPASTHRRVYEIAYVNVSDYFF